MALAPAVPDPRRAVALSLDLSHGPHGASARIELSDRDGADGGGARQVARVALRGWIESVAAGRIVELLEQLVARGVNELVLDLSGLRHIEYRQLPALADGLRRFEARAGGVTVCGLSRYLRDLFRLVGLDPPLRDGNAPANLARADGSWRGRAS
jgi:anti-anti-sigma factor